jgi:hypothetical protein
MHAFFFCFQIAVQYNPTPPNIMREINKKQDGNTVSTVINLVEAHASDQTTFSVEVGSRRGCVVTDEASGGGAPAARIGRPAMMSTAPMMPPGPGRT